MLKINISTNSLLKSNALRVAWSTRLKPSRPSTRSTRHLVMRRPKPLSVLLLRLRLILSDPASIVMETTQLGTKKKM